MADLVRLLNLSFPQWGVDARAAPLGGDGGAGARVEAAGRSPVDVRQGGGDPFGTWEVTVNGEDVAGGHGAIRSVSGVLLAVRRHLDPGFVPGRALIGVRPLAAAR